MIKSFYILTNSSSDSTVDSVQVQDVSLVLNGKNRRVQTVGQSLSLLQDRAEISQEVSLGISARLDTGNSGPQHTCKDKYSQHGFRLASSPSTLRLTGRSEPSQLRQKAGKHVADK